MNKFFVAWAYEYMHQFDLRTFVVPEWSSKSICRQKSIVLGNRGLEYRSHSGNGGVEECLKKSWEVIRAESGSV